jgi:hypothetical protein
MFNFYTAAIYVLLFVDLSSAGRGSVPYCPTMPLSTLKDKVVAMMDIDGESLYCSMAASQTSFAVTSIAKTPDGREIKNHVDVFSKKLLGEQATLEELQYLVQTSRLMEEKLSHKLPSGTGARAHQKEDRRVFLT